MVEFRCVCSRILWIMLKFVWVKVCVVYKKQLERKRGFGSDLNRVLDLVSNWNIFCIMGDLKGCERILKVHLEFHL